MIWCLPAIPHLHGWSDECSLVTGKPTNCICWWHTAVTDQSHARETSLHCKRVSTSCPGLKQTSYLQFNISKYKYGCLSEKSRHLTCISYTIQGNHLERVECFKYLGLLLTSDLFWSTHVDSICSKARKLLGLLYRKYYQYTELKLFDIAELSECRLYIDLCCSAPCWKLCTDYLISPLALLILHLTSSPLSHEIYERIGCY